MQLGNGRWESTVFNSRLQPIQIVEGLVEDVEQIRKSLIHMRAAFYLAFGKDAFEKAVRDKKDRKDAMDYLKRTDAY